jgi:hypothetical protein
MYFPLCIILYNNQLKNSDDKVSNFDCANMQETPLCTSLIFGGPSKKMQNSSYKQVTMVMTSPNFVN